MKILTLILSSFMLISSIFAQRMKVDGTPVIPSRDFNSNNFLQTFNYVPKKPGHYTAEDWQTVIDTTWGPGLPTSTKLQIFDQAWNQINTKFAAFQGLNVDWDSLKTVYRSQIDSTTSRGRFAAIMSYIMLALKEGHTLVWDEPVMLTPLTPGIPLLFMGGNADNTSWLNSKEFGSMMNGVLLQWK